MIDADEATPQTNERPLGLDPALLSAGEDASFVSHDGLRVSARLYLPSPELGYEGHGRSSTTSTAARRDRSGRTSRGSRCR